MTLPLHPNDPKGAAGALKCPLHLLPPVALRETAWVHGLGAAKYGPYNWRESKVNATTYVGAIMRHIALWSEGEDLDPESKRSHLAHIAASCNILMDAAASETLIDDRAKKVAAREGGNFVAMPPTIHPPQHTFESCGLTWIPHTPGDPMPCEGNREVRVIFAREKETGQYSPDLLLGVNWSWGDAPWYTKIVGWNYADEPQPKDTVFIDKYLHGEWVWHLVGGRQVKWSEFHNPEDYSVELVGEAYRLLLPEEVDGRFKKVAEFYDEYADVWRAASGANYSSGTYRVPISTPCS